MHRLVLENREHRFAAIEQRVARAIDVGIREGAEHLMIRFLGELMHDLPRRPRRVGDRFLRTCRLVRIDPAREERFETAVDARAAERLLHERVEAERWQVAFVEDDRMAQRNRLRVVGLVVDEVEERARSRAVAAIPVDERRAVQRHESVIID